MSSNGISIDLLYRNLVVKGNGPLNNILAFSYTDPLDRAGRFSLTVPANDRLLVENAVLLDSLDTVIRANYQGETVFHGVVKTIKRRVDGSGNALLDITGLSTVALLSDKSAGFTELRSGSAGVTNGPATILALTTGWSQQTASGNNPMVGYTTTTESVYAKFAGETLLQALVKIAEITGEHFVAGDEAKSIFWIRNNFVSSGALAVQYIHNHASLSRLNNPYLCIISKLEEIDDATERITRIYPFGSGTGAARLTLAAIQNVPGTAGMTTDTANNRITYNPGGEPIIERYIEFKEITPISNTDADVEAAADALGLAAEQWLLNHAPDSVFYRLSVIGLAPNVLRPGMTIEVQYADETHSVGDDLNVIEIAGRMSAETGLMEYDLTVSSVKRRPNIDAEYIAQRMQQGQVFTTHQQFGPTVDTIPYREALDDDEGAVMRFWLGEEIAQIQQVLLRFRVDPLRSTVKTVGGSASVDLDVALPSHTHSTPAHSHSVPDHTHQIGASQGSGGRNVGVFTGGGLYYEGSDVGVLLFNSTSSGGTTTPSGGGATSGSGGSGTASGTVDISGAITADYGVFEESGANTYAVTDLTYKINGANISATRETLGSGWYAYDLTAQVQNNSTLRPTQEAHAITVEVTTPAGKSAQIMAQLQVRAIIQSVAYG